MTNCKNREARAIFALLIIKEAFNIPRKPKYAKAQIETWKCGACDFTWYYQTMRCPLCTDTGLARIN